MWEITADRTQELLTLSAAEVRGGIVGVAFSPDGRRVMTGGNGIIAVKVWDVDRIGDAEGMNLPGNSDGWSGVAFSHDGRRLVASSGGAWVTVWDTQRWKALLRIDSQGPPADPPGAVTHVDMIEVSHDGALIATAAEGAQTAKVWDSVSGRRMFTVRHPAGINGMAWSPDGQVLATSSEAGVARIVDRSGKDIAVLRDDPGFGLGRVQFSPDGRFLATNRWRTERVDPKAEQVKIWDWRRREVVTTIPTAAGTLAFDPTGARIVTSHPYNGSAAIWDVKSGQKIATIAGHEGPILDVTFGPDGSLIATAGRDGTVRLWDARTGVQTLVLPASQIGVRSVAFSPDGSTLASGGSDGVVRVWALNIDDLIGIARRGMTRRLTDQECLQYVHVQRCPPATRH